MEFFSKSSASYTLLGRVQEIQNNQESFTLLRREIMIMMMYDVGGDDDADATEDVRGDQSG